MPKELKLYLDNHNQGLTILEKIGANKEKQIIVHDTYFNQPEGRVKKISIKGEDTFLVELQREDKGFKTIEKEKLEDSADLTKKLETELGIFVEIKRDTEYYRKEDKTFYLIKIDNVGSFLVVESENLSESYIKEDLGISNPKYLTVPFSDLVKSRT